MSAWRVGIGAAGKARNYYDVVLGLSGARNDQAPDGHPAVLTTCREPLSVRTERHGAHVAPRFERLLLDAILDTPEPNAVSVRPWEARSDELPPERSGSG